MNENYFVSISDPVFLEKNLLSNAKSALEFSLFNQEIKDIKSQKAELFVKLSDDVTQISSLLLLLEEKLPHKDLIKPVKSKVVSKSSAKKKSVVVPKAALTKVDKLNSSLADIERRLKDLS